MSRSGNIYTLLGEIRPKIDDIAWALSLTNRYVGSTTEPYNVADHSLLVSEMVPSHLAFQALMHDAHEAIIGDVAGPVKEAIRVLGGGWDQLEVDISRQVRRWYGLPIGLNAAIRKADRDIRYMEMRDLFTPEAKEAARGMGIPVAKDGHGKRIFPRTQRQAYRDFTETFTRIGNGIGL